MPKPFKWGNGHWCVWASVPVFVLLVLHFVEVFGVAFGVFLMDSFSIGGSILSSKCRFLSLTFLSEPNSSVHVKTLQYFSVADLLKENGFPAPFQKDVGPRKRTFQLHHLIFFSQFGENYTLRALLKIFLLYSWSDIWQQLSTKLCHKLTRWVFEKHLVSCSAFRIFKPM